MMLKLKGAVIVRKIAYLMLIMALGACQHAALDNSTTRQPGPTGVVKVITSGGFAAAYNILEPIFEAETGIDLQTSYGSSSGGAYDSIPVRLSQGQQFDVLIMSQGSLNKMTQQGYVRPDSRLDLVRSRIGMAVKEGAAIPDISSTEKFIAVLKNAATIGYSASASGRYLSTKLWPEMGIWEQIQNKSKRILSERVASVVARGEVEIGFQQISEILPIEGATYAGPIPAELQRITTFSTGITKAAQNAAGAAQLIRFLSSAEMAEVIAKTGLAPVVLEKQPSVRANN